MYRIQNTSPSGIKVYIDKDFHRMNPQARAPFRLRKIHLDMTVSLNINGKWVKFHPVTVEDDDGRQLYDPELLNTFTITGRSYEHDFGK